MAVFVEPNLFYDFFHDSLTLPIWLLTPWKAVMGQKQIVIWGSSSCLTIRLKRKEFPGYNLERLLIVFAVLATGHISGPESIKTSIQSIKLLYPLILALSYCIAKLKLIHKFFTLSVVGLATDANFESEP